MPTQDRHISRKLQHASSAPWTGCNPFEGETMEHHWIGPHFRSDFFGERYPDSLSLEDKIAIFSDGVRGWQLDVADKVLRQDRHSGFAALSIVISYFEMIARYEGGKGEYKHESGERRADP
ncbi:MAG TPA: hypothetical protein VM013_07805 [Dehalococcoidia bacterium]|nr:hypothetical protein [Dehalococcoidia bacterium]